MRADLEGLEAVIGYQFADRELLDRALTHSSHAHEHPGLEGASPHHNEQLEFLGDSVLGFVVSDALVKRFSAYREGRLSTLKARLVSAVHLHKVAVALDLGQYLQVGRSEEITGGRSKPNMLVNAMEALIAALYLDGGMEASRRFIERQVLGLAAPELDAADASETEAILDFKGALTHMAQTRGMAAPRYMVVKETGPAHARMFTVEVRLGAEASAHGEGVTKRAAAQQAARALYEKLAGPDSE